MRETPWTLNYRSNFLRSQSYSRKLHGFLDHWPDPRGQPLTGGHDADSVLVEDDSFWSILLYNMLSRHFSQCAITYAQICLKKWPKFKFWIQFATPQYWLLYFCRRWALYGPNNGKYNPLTQSVVLKWTNLLNSILFLVGLTRAVLGS